MSQLGPIGIKAFENRGISKATAERLGIYTGRADRDGKVVPDSAGNIVCFPTIEDGEVVAEKYRAANKRFWQRPGGRRTFYNVETIASCMATSDEEFNRAHPPLPLIIVEGEIDCASVIECGIQNVVSVPDGAPSAPTQTISVQEEQTGKFAFLFNNREKLAQVKRFIIAVDNDEPGQLLSSELVRRLSSSRCSFVRYPPNCKDLNDVLMRHGPSEVVRIINAAQPYPVRGLYRLSDYPDTQALQTFSTGWPELDSNLRLWPGELMVVTGIPGHGKSSWVINLAANVARENRWRSAIYSPEMPVVPHLRDKLRSIYIDRPVRAPDGFPVMTDAEIGRADEWIEDNFLFLDSDPGGAWQNDEDRTLEWIEERASEAVLRDGIRMLIIDPWNEVEHSLRRGENVGDYIGRGLRQLRRFAQEREVVVIVVAHPTKEVATGGDARMPSLYDIDGSANWFNKPDHGVVIFRPPDSDATRRVIVAVSKVRFALSGSRGWVYKKFDSLSERFLALDKDELAKIDEEKRARLAETAEAKRLKALERRNAKKSKVDAEQGNVVPFSKKED